MPEQSVNFDRAAAYYDETRGFPVGVAPKVGAFVADRLAFNQTTNLLEVGVGTGRIALPLAPYVGSIIGIDISWQMMGKLQQKSGGDNIHLAAADAHQIPFADNSFDVVYITHVLHLVPNPIRVLQEINRVVKPDSMFVHMRNRYDNRNDMQAVVEAWDAATKANPAGPRRWDSTDDIVNEAGWTLTEEYAYTFSYISKLKHFLARIEQRQWSSTWLMDDDTWQAGLEAAYRVIDEQFDGNRDFESPAKGTFQIQVYTSS